MGATLLSLVQSACAELGLPQPGTVAGAADQQTVQMYALINAVGADLLSRAQWTPLQTQTIIQVESPIITTGDTTANDQTITNIPTPPVLFGEPSNYVVSGNNIVTSARLTSETIAIPASLGMDTEATGDSVGGQIILARDTYPVPEDFTSFINDTEWDRGNKWRLMGPASPQMDQWMRSGIVPTGPRRWFRQVGRGIDVFRLWPPPGTNDVPGPLVYEYLSSYWAQSAAVPSVPKASFTADDDTCIYNDRLMIEGLKWRFYAAKGFDFSTQFSIWERQVQTAIGRDGGAPKLALARRPWGVLISPAQVADGDWPGRSSP